MTEPTPKVCTATLTYEARVAPLAYEHRTRVCSSPRAHVYDMHFDGSTMWSDTAPGARS